MTHDELKAVLDRLVEISALAEQLPGGVDYDADPENQSPEDATAHVGGLIWQVAYWCIAKIQSDRIEGMP